MTYDPDPLSEFISFRILTPEEILESENRQTILTPREKFERIQKHLDKRARRLRKYHFVAVDTKTMLFIFDGEGIEIGQFENSVKGCRLAREKCLKIFLAADNKFGGYTFSGPNFENLSDEEREQFVLATHKHLDYHSFSKSEVREWNYESSGDYSEAEVKQKKNYCWLCEFQFTNVESYLQHVCTDNWVLLNLSVYNKNFGLEGRIELR